MQKKLFETNILNIVAKTPGAVFPYFVFHFVGTNAVRQFRHLFTALSHFCIFSHFGNQCKMNVNECKNLFFYEFVCFGTKFVLFGTNFVCFGTKYILVLSTSFGTVNELNALIIQKFYFLGRLPILQLKFSQIIFNRL